MVELFADRRTPYDLGVKLRQLHYFLAVVDLGSLRRAAKELGISEPALSKSVQQLEALLGVPLLDRAPRGMKPTVYGESLIAHARIVRSELEQAVVDLGEMRGLSHGLLRVGTGPTSAMVELPRTLARFHTRYPDIRTIVREGLLSELMPDILHGELDFAVVAMTGEPTDADLVLDPLVESGLGIIARGDHRLAGKPKLSAAQLADLPWLLPPRQDMTRIAFDAIWARTGLKPLVPLAESSSILFMLSCIRESDAVAFLPASVTDLGGSGEQFVQLDVPGLNLQRQLGVVRRSRTTLSPAARMMLRELKAVARELSLRQAARLSIVREA
jgi:DNA-binding transcriptional LysR family regulator